VGDHFDCNARRSSNTIFLSLLCVYHCSAILTTSIIAKRTMYQSSYLLVCLGAFLTSHDRCRRAAMWQIQLCSRWEGAMHSTFMVAYQSRAYAQHFTTLQSHESNPASHCKEPHQHHCTFHIIHNLVPQLGLTELNMCVSFSLSSWGQNRFPRFAVGLCIYMTCNGFAFGILPFREWRQ
jgi:hypothetical protein